MKKLLGLLLLAPFLTQAQLGGKTIVKANLSSLALKNYHATIERSLTKKISLSVSYRFQPKGATPLQSQLENLVDDPDFNIGRFQLGNNAITPELRIYFGKGRMKGFYIAPYARFATFDLTAPVKYNSSSVPGAKKDADFSGKIKSTSGGIMFGIQHQLAKKLVLDFWILGAHYGSSTGQMDAIITPAMTTLEQQSLQQSIDDFKEAGPFKFEGKVTSSTAAYIKSTGPWAGIRGAMLSLGFRF